MQQAAVLALGLLSLSVPCVGLRQASLPVAVNDVCPLLASTQLVGDADIGLFSAARVSNETADMSAKRAVLTAAITDYQAVNVEFKAVKTRYDDANAKLMVAIEDMLLVPSVDGPALAQLATANAKALVVFYAPWCPHCQSFVLHDGTGDPTKAPLEILAKDLKTDPATANVEVVRYDVQKQGEVPGGFEVQGIPAVYFQNGETKTKFNGNAHDSTALAAFVKTEIA